MAYLENRHGGLNARVDLKTSTDAEFSDWLQNKSEEEWLVVQGLPRITNSNGNWQDQARRQVADLIKLVLHVNRTNLNFEVLFVSNPFRYQTNRQPQYNVMMDSVSSCKRIREIFSGFFRHDRPVAKPPALKGISIRNKLTPNTKIRIAILHQLGSIYTESNRGGSYKVQGYGPRPLLITIPPKNSTERQRTYNFIQAVSLLPATFSDEHLTQIYQVVSGQQTGNLQALFVVLNDDDRERCLELVKQKRLAQVRTGQPSASMTVSGSLSGPGAGIGLQDSSLGSLLALPPPPPPSGVDKTPVGVTESPYGAPDHLDRDRDRSRSRGRDRDRSRSRSKDKEG